MCHNKCTANLNSLINNINDESLKKICANIGERVIIIIIIMDKKITDFYAYLEESNDSIRPMTNQHLLQKHFLLRSIVDVNNELLKHDAGFVLGVFVNLNNQFHQKMFDRPNTFTPENVYKDMLYIKSLIKKHTNDDKLLIRLEKPDTYLHVFYLTIIPS